MQRNIIASLVLLLWSTFTIVINISFYKFNGFVTVSDSHPSLMFVTKVLLFIRRQKTIEEVTNPLAYYKTFWNCDKKIILSTKRAQ